jgi:hypothetical protein
MIDVREKTPRLTLLPVRAWADIAVLTVLAVIGILGFAPSFTDQQYLWAGLGGLAVGTAAGILAAMLRLGPVLTFLLGVGAYFLLGSAFAMPQQAIAFVVPSLQSLAGLAVGAVFGWADMVTLTTPVAAPDYIGVLPYVAAWAVGLISTTIAGRWFATHRRSALASLLALIAPTAVYVASVLTGTDEAYLAAARGVAFAAIALIWMAWRVPVAAAASSRMRSTVLRQKLIGVAIIGVAAIAGGVVLGGAAAPPADSRFVLRDKIEPPFDPTIFPSPLSGFRAYLKEDLKDEVIFRVRGLDEGDRVRLATMDAYDGRVWNVTGPELNADGSGTFRLVSGEQLPTTGFLTPGDPVDATITIEAYRDVWIPSVGYPTSIRFTGGPVPSSTAIRYNDATGIAVDLDRLGEGMTYAVDAIPQAADADISGLEDAAVATVNLPPATNVPDFVGARATEWSADAETPYDKLTEIAANLREGFLSHGREGEPASPAGHGADRMNRLLDPNVAMVGDQEQYASAFALMARFLGYPSRVVMGFTVEGSDVTGEDVDAWAEVAFDGIGWVAFDPTPENTDVPTEQKPKPKSKPQPLVRQPPRDEDGQDDLVSAVGIDDSDDENRFTIPRWVWTVAAAVGIPLALYFVPLLVIRAIKQRRRRRRYHDRPDRSAAGAWEELSDAYAELGYQAPRDATRVQLALLFEQQFQRELDARTREQEDAQTRARNRDARREAAAEQKRAQAAGTLAAPTRSVQIGNFLESTVLRAKDASTWRPGVTASGDPLPSIPGLREFAVAADAAVFSGRDLEPEDVERLWAQSSEAQGAARRSVSWFRRRLAAFRVRARLDVAGVIARLNAMAPRVGTRKVVVS